MKAAILKEIGKAFSVEEAPDPVLAPDEVLVETHTCGICRTDLHVQDGLAYVPSLPHIPGHEPAGVVVEVGREAKGVALGQRVVPHLFVSSSECRNTRAGEHAQARHLRGIIGVTLPGGFAEYFKAPARNLLPLPDNVPFDVGGLTSCAVITAVHALRKADLQPGDLAVVFGVGGIGLLLVQLLSDAGVRSAAISRSAASLDLARQAGASWAIPAAAEDVADRVRACSIDGKDGADCVFEMIGLAQTMRLAASLCTPGGKIIVIGEEAECPAIDTIQIAQRELQIIGSRNGGMQDARDAIDLMARGLIRPVISATYPLRQINQALRAVRGGQAHGRVIIQVRE
ncbi:MAG TPA: alcohol dehydrogenase catalytic domain-containing protein [Pirellulales bacterium]|nr:alcohol dehydrogenase catalytic domain-containing protein [Pirellulales bacterium]